MELATQPLEGRGDPFGDALQKGENHAYCRIDFRRAGNPSFGQNWDLSFWTIFIVVCGCGSKLSNWGYAGFSLPVHLPGFHFGPPFFSHTHVSKNKAQDGGLCPLNVFVNQPGVPNPKHKLAPVPIPPWRVVRFAGSLRTSCCTATGQNNKVQVESHNLCRGWKGGAGGLQLRRSSGS